VGKLRYGVAMAVSAGALALAASADAGVAFYSFGMGAPSQQLITNFSNESNIGGPPTHTPSSPAGYSWSGSGVILNTTSGIGAEPAIASGYGTGPYLSVQGGDWETLNIPVSAGFKDIGIYVGSLDAYNTLIFTLADGTSVSYTGSYLGGLSGAANGDQTAANTNGLFDFSFTKAVKSIEFQSTSDSFEIASISAGVPEPATWAMLILGVAMIGFVARRRNEALYATA
jgi:hypothetical protein